MKRVFAVFLSCLLLISILPVCAGAEEDAWYSPDKIRAQIPNATVSRIEGFDPQDYPFLSGASGFGVGDRNYTEFEPNDTPDAADFIESDYTVEGAFSGSQDVDFFAFNLPEDGGIAVVAASYAQSGVWCICDESGNLLVISEDIGSDEGVYTDVIIGSLPAGTYYLIGLDMNDSVSEYLFYFESHSHIYSSQTDATCDICQYDRTVGSDPGMNVPSVDQGIPFSQSEWEVLKITNRERQNAGLAPLTGFDKLQDVAHTRAAELQVKYDHTRPNGTSCFTALDERNVPYGWAGENIAYGQRSAQEVMTDWMNSEGHRKNILTQEFNHLGVGRDGTGWAQMFISGGDYTSISVEAPADPVNAGTSIDALNLVAVLESRINGTCYLPVFGTYCSGYDPNHGGTQTVTISVLGVQSTFPITVSGAPSEPVIPAPNDPPEEPDRTAIFRMYNPFTQEHLLTSDRGERNSLIGAGWSLDGTAWHAPKAGTPVFRLYNPYDDFHFYTMSQAEVNSLLPMGWTLDGPVSFSATAENGTPVYRLFNPYASTNYHLFTASVEERDWLASLGWQIEGVAWYALK